LKPFEPNLERIGRDILNLSQITSPQEPGYTRISFSEEDRNAREHIRRLMEQEAGLQVRVDELGNLVGRRKGKKEKPSILIGSHIDTVRGGGRFDGVSGVIGGLEVARLFRETGFNNDHPLEVVVFLAEEPSPFGLSTIGSRGMAGKLTEEHLTSLKDREGRDLGTSIREMGGRPEAFREAKRSRSDILVYLEIHIEQGPDLFLNKIPLGIVKGIVGISRAKIEVIGMNDHAGTTPMSARKDALAAASEVVLAVEKICSGKEGLVGTVGKIDAFPNALNVIPGKVTLGVDVRSLHAEGIDRAFCLLRTDLDRISERRGVQVRMEKQVVSIPVTFEARIIERIRRVCHRLRIPCQEMISGAGHDAMHIAQIARAGMIFVPSQGGRSHCPEEWTEFEHISKATEVLASTIAEIDQEGER
jgi:hydantoinase/carbamoylase family amidase